MRVGQSTSQHKSTGQSSSNLITILLSPAHNSNASAYQREYLSLCRIDSFLLTLIKMRETLAASGITQNISCYPACREAVKHIDELDGAQVKHTIQKILCNYIAELNQQAKTLKQSFWQEQSLVSMQKAFNRDEAGQLTNTFLQRLMEKMKVNLKNGFQKKKIYGLIHFKWTNQFIKTFNCHLEQTYHSLAQIELEIEALNALYFAKNSQQFEQMGVDQLFKRIDNKKVAELLQREFKVMADRLKNKDVQCDNLHNQLYEFQEIIKSQIILLAKQQDQKRVLNDQLQLSSAQLANLNKKCQMLQQELIMLDQQLKKLNENELNPQQSYYVNPLWQKQQLEEKYYVELIQLQSDLLLQKQQVKQLVNIILESIKLSHEVFYDMRASKFMIYRFDREMAKLLKTSAFDKINLEEHLIVREEGMESESSPEMHKSTISTYSEVDTESKFRSQRQIILFQSFPPEFKQQ